MSALQPFEPQQPHQQPHQTPRQRAPDRIDQRVTLHGMRWQDYEAMLAIRGESNATRVTYLNGALELMSPSFDHETLKTTLGRLIEAYADECGIDLIGCGSWTLRNEREARGVEADECYVLGPIEAPPALPDLAVEVVWTSGGLDKLEVYRGLGVPEVWFWQNATLRIYVLAGDTYQEARRSHLLPALDPDLIVRCISCPSQTQAVRALREALR